MNQTSVPPRRSWLSIRSLSCSIVCGRRNTSRDSAGFGELCGRAAAEGAAICCCCPLAIAKFLVLAIYKIPAGLCHRAISKVQRRKGLIEPCNQQGGCGCDCDNRDFQIQAVERVEGSEESQKAVKELEKEMLQKFYGSGFWRSPNCQSRI